ncbi:hypothetical protein FBY05_11873 [Pseudomonas sp. SJZ083]|nr:hypothetical protein FBY05_11873 [Pseudomonas sp. SJZ083]TWC44175.1 hypothetical protein FBY01_11865 [Pseudomonas sp. SJZ077]
MRKPWPTFSTESAGFCLSPPSDSDRLLPVVPTAVRRSLLIMDAKQGFQIEYKRGSMECYFVRYSNWYSNQNTKLILTIIINRINYRFKLPRPTTSTKKDVHGRLFLCLKIQRVTCSCARIRQFSFCPVNTARISAPPSCGPVGWVVAAAKRPETRACHLVSTMSGSWRQPIGGLHQT